LVSLGGERHSKIANEEPALNEFNFPGKDDDTTNCDEELSDDIPPPIPRKKKRIILFFKKKLFQLQPPL
jgi:hypothetical protein